MMTFIAFTAVAAAFFLGGIITAVLFAAWLDEKEEKPPVRKNSDVAGLYSILDYSND